MFHITMACSSITRPRLNPAVRAVLVRRLWNAHPYANHHLQTCAYSFYMLLRKRRVIKPRCWYTDAVFVRQEQAIPAGIVPDRTASSLHARRRGTQNALKVSCNIIRRLRKKGSLALRLADWLIPEARSYLYSRSVISWIASKLRISCIYINSPGKLNYTVNSLLNAIYKNVCAGERYVAILIFLL